MGPIAVLRALGWWLFWPSLLLALSSAQGYLRPS
jgi:CDP-diacylglycerol--glycerol-3-phosphate 3-phosphatidyltransferase